MGVFCRRSLAEYLDADRIFDVTKQGFDYFEELFARPYPFEKYDQLFVPEFNAGAMENAGAVTILEDYVFRSKVTDAAYERRAETILHELAHMWFGDLVTMHWWDDLWLNESFATYASVLCQSEATHWTNAWTTFANLEKTWAYRQDQLPSTHPISADIRDLDDVEVNFDGITYAKGASVLKQLVAYVGRDAFFAGVRDVLRPARVGQHRARRPARRAGGDLRPRPVELGEGVAGDRRAQHAARRVRGRRRRALHLVRRRAGGARRTHPTLRSHRIAIGLYDRGARRPGARPSGSSSTSSASAPTCPSWSAWHSPTSSWSTTTTSRTPRSGSTSGRLETLVDHIGELSDSLARALCWTAAWDMTRDAELLGARLGGTRPQRAAPRDRHRRPAGCRAAGRVCPLPLHPGGRPRGRRWPRSPTHLQEQAERRTRRQRPPAGPLPGLRRHRPHR